MKLPTYEQQNSWMRAYVMPLFEFDFAKMLRNYRLRNSNPLTDTGIAQLRGAVLAEAREELDAAFKAHDPIHEYRYDDTYTKGTEKIRSVRRSAHGGGRLRLAPLEIDYVKKDPVACLEKELLDLLARRPDLKEVVFGGHRDFFVPIYDPKAPMPLSDSYTTNLKAPNWVKK